MSKPEKPLYIFLHMHKTAGMTLITHFRLHLQEKECLPMYVGPMDLDPEKDPEGGWDAGRIEAYAARHVGRDTRFIYGHMSYYGIDRLAPGRRPFYFTFLRDPVERVISLYYYHCKWGGRWHKEITDNDWSLEQWIEKSKMPWKSNGQIRQLLWHSHPEVLRNEDLTKEHLEAARQTLARYWFVGLQEHFRQDFHYLYGCFGFWMPYSLNAVHVTTGKQEVPAAVREKIARANALDMELYEFARECRGRFIRENRASYRWQSGKTLLFKTVIQKTQRAAAFIRGEKEQRKFKGEPSSDGVFHQRYLEDLEKQAEEVRREELYLWPRTPIGDEIQDVIARRMGASDLEVQKRNSRPSLIIRQIRSLIAAGLIPVDFSILDIACGDALVLWQIKKAFPKARCYGLDCNKGAFGSHAMAQKAGVRLYKGYLQHLFKYPFTQKPEKFDLALMLNTYRGWESADLKEEEKFLPQMADAWFEKSARFVIVTATGRQISRLKDQRLNVRRMGKGEDQSTMICWTRQQRPLPGPRTSLYDLAAVPLYYIQKIFSMPWWVLRNLRYYGPADTLFFCRRLAGALLKRKLTAEVLYNEDKRAGFFGKRWPVNKVSAGTTYIFVFLGEFGYELLNWQAVVRKFAGTLPRDSDIVIGGRRGLEAFYESAAQYIDISAVPAYQESFAAAYFAMSPQEFRRRRPPTSAQIRFDAKVRKELSAYLTEKINRPGRRLEFVFSSVLTAYPGCTFGADPRFYGTSGHPGSIYARLNLENNLYRKVEPDDTRRQAIEKQLGFSLEEPYLLVQTRRRFIGPKAGGRIDEGPFIEALAAHWRVVILNFNTGRNLDSISSPKGESAVVYPAESFRDQSCLIAHARKCIFFTEGDLGSHTYLPPLLGRDVLVAASRDVFQRKSAPVEFWNENVFRFGGQMIPLTLESVTSPEDFAETVKSLLDKDEKSRIESPINP